MKRNNNLILSRLISMNEYFSVILPLLCSFHLVTSSVLTQYDGLEDDYWKWKESFGPKKSILGYFQASPDTYPLQYDELQKKVQCHTFVESNNYVYVKSRMEQSVKKGDSEKTHLKSSKAYSPDDKICDVMIGSRKDSLKMFQCAIDEEDKYVFHLTSSYQKDYTFVVTSRKNEKGKMKNVILQALLQFDATIDEKALQHEEELNAMFWKNVNEAITQLRNPNLKNLCFMSDQQHFNICSVVADKLYREPTFHEFRSNSSLNYIYNITDRCAYLQISDGAGRTQLEDVMPCAINNENWSEPQFYLLRHITSTNLPASVYVLTNRDDGTLGLYTRIDNVMAMTMP